MKEKTMKEKNKQIKEADDTLIIVNKIYHNQPIDILKLLARNGYYVYCKDKKGEPSFYPSEKLIIKLMSNILNIHKKDGCLNEMYIDNNVGEMRQKGFEAFQDTVTRCFPDIIFPVEWFGGYDKKYWADIQMLTLTGVLDTMLGEDGKGGFQEQIKGFFNNKFNKDRGVLLDWCIHIRGLSKTQAFTFVADEIDKSASYVRDHCK